MLAQKEKSFKADQPQVSLSELAAASEVPKKRRTYLRTSRLENPKLYSFANKDLRNQTSTALHDLERTEKGDLGRKFFYLDHTAEVLENYRRLQENELFEKVLHETR